MIAQTPGLQDTSAEQGAPQDLFRALHSTRKGPCHFPRDIFSDKKSGSSLGQLKLPRGEKAQGAKQNLLCEQPGGEQLLTCGAIVNLYNSPALLFNNIPLLPVCHTI